MNSAAALKLTARALAAGALLMLCGCGGVPVAEQIDQKQALEIVALLNSYGISAAASKERQGYTVTVKSGVYAQAVSLMQESKLPAEKRMSFRELVGEQGLIPSSREVEAMRLDHALAVEIEDLLENHPDIAAVKAVVRLNFRKDGSTPGVSLVLQNRAGRIVSPDDIAKLVLGVAPGVARENISIAVAPELSGPSAAAEVGRFNQDGRVVSVPLVGFLFWRVPEGSLAAMAGTFMGVLVLAVAVGWLSGYAWAVYRQAKSGASRDAPEGVPLLSLKIEKGKKGLPGV